MVSESGTSTTTLPRKRPVSPPFTNVTMKATREQQRDREMDIAAPQGQHPVVDLDGGRDGDDERAGGEEEPEIGIHAAARTCGAPTR